MNQTVDALKTLYAALGGNSTDVANITLIPDMINAIAEQVSANRAEAENSESTEEDKT